MEEEIKVPVVDEESYLSKLPRSQETGQYKITVEKQNLKELVSLDSFNEVAVLRVFYWAAYYGKEDFVTSYMILMLKWSPFIKSF